MLLQKGTTPRTVWRMSMVCLLAFFTLTYTTRSVPSNWQDLLDGVRGAFLGATLALMVVYGILRRRSTGPGAPSVR